MTKEQFIEVTQWQKATFAKATPSSKIAHLKEEIAELETDILFDNPIRRLEYADCFLLLFGAAHADGMSYEDICSAIGEKMSINKARRWGKPNDLGVVNHVKE